MAKTRQQSEGNAQRESQAETVMDLRKDMAQRLREIAKEEFTEENVVDWAVQRALDRVAEAFEVGVKRRG